MTETRTERPLPPYSLTTEVPGRRWRVVHRTPGQEVVCRTYFVARGTFALTCSCPAYRFGGGKPCKHTKFVAKLIGEPGLAAEPVERGDAWEG